MSHLKKEEGEKEGIQRPKSEKGRGEGGGKRGGSRNWGILLHRHKKGERKKEEEEEGRSCCFCNKGNF